MTATAAAERAVERRRAAFRPVERDSFVALSPRMAERDSTVM
ncbi:MAG TPA: hypothetical protein VGB76_21130 [Pyrinomonadaceae bacterium]